MKDAWKNKANRKIRRGRSQVLRRGRHPCYAEFTVYIAEALQSSVYGRCIAQDFNGVYKDKCLAEFLKLKDCYTVCHIFDVFD